MEIYAKIRNSAYMYYARSRDPAYNTDTQSHDPVYNMLTQSHDPAYNMHMKSRDSAYKTHTQSQKCIHGVKMSNFGDLSVPVKEVMKKFVFISLLYFYVYSCKKNVLGDFFKLFFYSAYNAYSRSQFLIQISRRN